MKGKLKLKLIAFVLLTLIVSSMLAACGESYNKSDIAIGESADGYLTEDSLSGSAQDGEQSADSVKESRKIIETITYSVQTKNFDDFVTKLETYAVSVGGYIENSDVSGNSYDDVSSRYATYTFRIPSDKVDEFVSTVSENSTVTNRTVNTEDVTLEYVDVESRIKALKTEKNALEDLLASATSTKEIMEIRDMLTDVIYEIETYESRLRTLDNLVDYTTITVDIDEVEHPVVVKEQTTWQRIGTNLANNCRSLWNFLVEVFVFIVSASPILLFVAVIVIVVVVIIKRIAKKSQQKRLENPPKPISNTTVPYYQTQQKPTDDINE